MGDGIVNQTFTANITDLENKLAQAERAQSRLTEQLKKTRQESKEGHNEILHGLTEQAGVLVGMVTKYASVAIAVEALAESYKKWEEGIEKVGQANEKLGTSLTQQLAKAGLVKHGKEIEQWTEEAAKKGYTREQAQSALFGAVAGGPLLGLKKQKEIAEVALKGSPLMTPGELEKHSETVGHMQVFMPGKKPQEVENLVTGLEKRLGKTKAAELTNRGFMSGVRGLIEEKVTTPEEALAIGEIAVRNDLSPKFLEQIASKVIAPPKPPNARGRHMTEKEVAETKFYKEGMRERLMDLLGNPEMQEAIVGQKRDRVGRITLASIDAEKKVLGNLSRENVAEKDVAALKEFPAGLSALDDQKRASKKDVADIQAKVRAHAWKGMYEAYEEKEKELTGKNKNSLVGRAALSSMYGLARTFDFASNLLGVDDEQHQRDRPARIMKLSGYFNDEEVQEFRRENEEYSRKQYGYGEGAVGVGVGPAASDAKERREQHQELMGGIHTNQATNAAQAARVNGRE